MLNCISFLFLVQFSALTVTANTLAFFAVTAFISVERTFVEEFCHFVGVEIGLTNFRTGEQEGLESFFLDEDQFRADKDGEDGEGGVKGSVLQDVDELFFAEIFLGAEDTLSDILSSFF